MDQNDVENFVNRWLDQSIKIKAEALDLRSTIPYNRITDYPSHQMTTDVQQQANNRNIFKMNTDFWQQARGPPLGNHPLTTNLMISTSTPSSMLTNNLNAAVSAATSLVTNSAGVAGGCPSVSPISHHGPVLSPTTLHHQLQQQLNQQQQTNLHQQSANMLSNMTSNGPGTSSGSLTTPIPGSGGHLTPSDGTSSNMHMHLAAVQQQNHQQNQLGNSSSQQHPPQSHTPGGSSTPDNKMNTEKLVNEFQVSRIFFFAHFFTYFYFFSISVLRCNNQL